MECWEVGRAEHAFSAVNGRKVDTLLWRCKSGLCKYDIRLFVISLVTMMEKTYKVLHHGANAF